MQKLAVLEYVQIRQKGSHIRIQTKLNGIHSETIPNHKPLKLGTLRSILKNIAKHHQISLENIEIQLFK